MGWYWNWFVLINWYVIFIWCWLLFSQPCSFIILTYSIGILSRLMPKYGKQRKSGVLTKRLFWTIWCSHLNKRAQENDKKRIWTKIGNMAKWRTDGNPFPLCKKWSKVHREKNSLFWAYCQLSVSKLKSCESEQTTGITSLRIDDTIVCKMFV